VSPILVRPVREQFEHDRVIRLLQARYRRKFEVAINPGPEQNASVMSGELAVYPDLLLFSQERGHKLQGTVEVETGESVNTLEAMAEWGPFSRLRAPFFLYVPPNSLDTARRLCTEHQVTVSEIWTYHTAADQVRFTMVHRAPDAPPSRAKPDRVEMAVKPKEPVEAKPAKKAVVPAKPAPVPVRQPQAGPEPSRAAKKPAPAPPPRPAPGAKKAAPAPVRRAPARPEHHRAAKKSAKSAKSAKAGKSSKTAKKAARRR
jgi:hypothetical protein